MDLICSERPGRLFLCILHLCHTCHSVSFYAGYMAATIFETRHALDLKNVPSMEAIENYLILLFSSAAQPFGVRKKFMW